jgi:hypothetical protein
MSKQIESQEKEIDNSFGPQTRVRDEHGLLKNVAYKFNEDGSVNWRGMASRDKIYPNKDWFKRNGKDIPNSIDGLPDYQLVITLAGLKELANLRGFRSVQIVSIESSKEFACASCGITWIGNYESENRDVVYNEIASAHIDNVDDFGKKYLDTIAANRAFSRSIRNFLNIHVVSADEIDKSNSKTAVRAAGSESTPVTPQAVLHKKFSEYGGGTTFPEFKDFLRDLWAKERYQNKAAANWGDFSDIPPREARKLIGILSSE